MRAVWKNIPLRCANDLHEVETEIQDTIAEINNLGINLGFTYLDTECVEELLQSHDKELEVEDLIRLEQDRTYDNQETDNKKEAETKEFTLKELEEIFRIGELYKQKIMDGDPNLARSLRVSREIDKAVFCFKVMYEETKKCLKQIRIL
ncbi:hypothetical protein QE152_g16999 [Popillia japonica]|uniref:Uncharacterized protein n=1 Tax=Popillia japonica TaxID=7064 RepID=A0AAW1L653_POPJA